MLHPQFTIEDLKTLFNNLFIEVKKYGCPLSIENKNTVRAIALALKSCEKFQKLRWNTVVVGIDELEKILQKEPHSLELSQENFRQIFFKMLASDEELVTNFKVLALHKKTNSNVSSDTAPTSATDSDQNESSKSMSFKDNLLPGIFALYSAYFSQSLQVRNIFRTLTDELVIDKISPPLSIGKIAFYKH